MARGALTCITVVGCEGQDLHGISRFCSRQAAGDGALKRMSAAFVPVGAWSRVHHHRLRG